MRVKHSLVARALVAAAPFAVVAPGLEVLRLANDASATTAAGALALLRPEFLTGAGVALLAAAGADFSHVARTTVFMVDLGEFAAMNDVYAKYFTAPYPARSTVQVVKLPKDVRVEIDVIAVLG